MYSSPGKLVINLDAIKSNWHMLNREVGLDVECAAVVKADAYGLGVAMVSGCLLLAGCRCFFVSSLTEGIELRGHLGVGPIIYILHGCEEGSEMLFVDHDLRPVLVSIGMARRWGAWLTRSGASHWAALKVNSGMNRLGLSCAEAQSLLMEEGRFFAHISLLVSHMACADEPGHPLNLKQLHTFESFGRMVSAQGYTISKSLSNSSAIFLGLPWHFDLVRPGVALYGVNPAPYQRSLVQAVVTLSLRIIQVREVSAGESVGYGASYTSSSQRVLAIVAGGYADGVNRLLSNSGQAWLKGHLIAIVGRVSMDAIALDITPAVDSGELVMEGDMVELIGEHITLEEHAACANTIAYEALTQLGARFDRVYIHDGCEMPESKVRS